MNTNKNTRPETAATDYRLVRKYQREAAKQDLQILLSVKYNMRTATKRFTRTELLQETVSMDRSSRSMPYVNGVGQGYICNSAKPSRTIPRSIHYASISEVTTVRFGSNLTTTTTVTIVQAISVPAFPKNSATL